MTFMSDMRSGIVRVVERDEHDLVVAQWSALVEREIADLPVFEIDGVLVDLFRAQVIA